MGVLDSLDAHFRNDLMRRKLRPRPSDLAGHGHLLLRTTLGRFGIPARYYFPRTLDTHPVSRFFFGLLDAILANWEYETLLPLIRMHYSGIAPSPEADRIDHALRERMPARGFPGELAALASWQALEHWRTASFTPAEWAGQLKQLRTLIRLPAITDQVPHEQVLEWRELLSALDAWDEALQQTAALGDDAPASLVEFRMQLAEVASHVAISDKDQRRNVVHVLDVYEARQWSLPVVFVCGLLERAFPQYHSEHPILADEDRETLRAQRVVLRTSSERQREEVVLFENAVQCATEELILSYPRTNSKGEETLPSFFLNRLSRSRPLLQETTVACRPQPRWPAAPLPSSSITAKQALAMLRRAATTLSPTAIETYLQCPFQFLARSVLRVNTPPVAPLDRLDFLLQGSIIHDTLAATEGSPLFVEEIFSRLFDDACQKKSLASGCRTERVRLELHNNLRRFLESPPLTGAATVGVEHGFKLKLNDDLRISGKMDRVAQLPDRGLVVIDYKYSSRARVRDRVRSHDRGELVQGGLYLWAAEKLYKQNLAGMLYCGLRGEVTWAGWHIPAFGWDEIGESTDAIRLREIIDGALESSIAVAQRIAAGDIAPAPADRKKCDWCEYRDTCRIELEAAPALVQLVSGGGE
jgi:ATP-dependent helicase/DNAse subunit B